MTDQMTNQHKHVQPAPRPLNLLVRGGRLTKRKGRVVSIASGLSVVAAAAALFSGSAAHADNECGDDSAGQNTVTCGANDSSYPNYDGGITYENSDGLTLILDDDDITVRGSGVSVAGAIGSEGDISVQLKKGDVDMSGNSRHGIEAFTRGDGAVTVQMSGDDSTVTVDGSLAYALKAEISNSSSEAAAKVEVTGGKITVEGGGGLWASTNGSGDVIALLDGGTILSESHGINANVSNLTREGTTTAHMIKGHVETSGNASHGIWASSGFGRGGDVLARMDGGSVTTFGEGSDGIVAMFKRSENAGVMATAHMTGGHVKTNNDDSVGLRAISRGFGTAVAQMDGDSIVTTIGERAHGVYAETRSGKAIVNLGVDAVVTSSGLDADGIHVTFSGVGTASLDVDVAGSVMGGAGTGAAIRMVSNSSTGGTIDITSTATVSAGESGIALHDGDGSGVITSAGTVTGDIRLGAGDDTLILTGGRLTGDIYGGAGDDTVTIAATTIYDGSYIETDQFRIEAGSVFRASGGASGTLTIAAAVTNNGIFSVQDGVAGDEIRIEGNYSGSGTSVFALDTRMDGTGTDRVVITGDASGDMVLSISGLDSAGAVGGPLMIDVVTVGGTSDATFTLDGNYVMSDGEHGVIAGAYLYTLSRTDGGWALSALSETGETNYQPSAPIYDSYGQSLLALNGPKSLRNRGSSEDFRILAWEGGTGDQDTGSPLWLQMGADRITLSEENSTTGAALESTVWEMAVGADIVLREIGSGLLVGGLMGSYAMGSTDVTSAFGDGSIDTTGLGLGVAATWYDTRRFYVDGQVTLAAYTSDLEADRIGTLTEGNSGTGFAVSLEAGQQLDLGSRLTVIPQAQLSVSSVAFDDFASEARGEQVTFENASSQQLRLGFEFGLQEQEARRLYGIVNLFYEFGSGSEVDVAGAALTTESEPWAAGVGLGGTYVWNDRMDLFGETSYTTGLGNVGDTSALSVNAGFKVTF